MLVNTVKAERNPLAGGGTAPESALSVVPGPRLRRRSFKAPFIVATAPLALLLSVCGSATPASAEGFFEMLFGLGDGPRSNSYADPHDPVSGVPGGAIQRRPASSGGTASSGGATVSYCVRGCDGRYFPISSQGGATEACNAFCPAARTTVFRGRGIDNATDARGRPYSASENAFVYRDKIIPGCTCDGKGPGGLAHIDIKDDPTLKTGDIVATPNGFAAFAGARHQDAQFTPLTDSRALGADLKKQLLATQVRPSRTREAVTPRTGPQPSLNIVSNRANGARQADGADTIRLNMSH